MTLKELQQQAWLIAEAKGHHKLLDGVTSLDTRLQALLALSPVYGAITALTQEIKRHGLVNIDTLRRYITALINTTTECWYTIGHSITQPLEVSPSAWGYAAIIRLVLAHSEIDEAIDVIYDTDIHDKEMAFAGELSDELIRIAELAYGLGIDLDASTQRILDQNTQRPYGYGTPEQGQV